MIHFSQRVNDFHKFFSPAFGKCDFGLEKRILFGIDTLYWYHCIRKRKHCQQIKTKITHCTKKYLQQTYNYFIWSLKTHHFTFRSECTDIILVRTVRITVYKNCKKSGQVLNLKAFHQLHIPSILTWWTHCIFEVLPSNL